MAAPDLRTAVRSGAAHLERMADALAAYERDGRVTDAAYANLQHEFDVLGGYTLDQRVDSALSGLGFDRTEWSKPPAAMSGGEQTRASLARLVIADPDLLLLDEPTNHLDLDALEWLEDHLRKRAPGRCWSHRTTGRSSTRPSTGSGSSGTGGSPRSAATTRAYHRQREERDARAVKDADDARPSRSPASRSSSSATAAIASSPRCTSTRHGSSGSRRSAPRRRARDAKLAIPSAALAGAGPTRSGEVVVRVEGMVVGYLPGRGAQAEDGTARDRAAAPSRACRSSPPSAGTGSASSGRTARARPRSCARSPGSCRRSTGRITFGHNVQLGYLAQLREAAIPGATVLDALLEAIPVTPGEARSYLARFLFRGDDVAKEVRPLSGGERSRLELALLGIQPSNLLLLDEPTNHLDIPAREAIEAFMTGSPATLIVVSHDRRLLETVCERLWVVDDGVAAPFDGGYRAWRAAVAGGWTVAGGPRGRGEAAAHRRPRNRAAPTGRGDAERRADRRHRAATAGRRRTARPCRPPEPRPRKRREALEGRLPPAAEPRSTGS